MQGLLRPCLASLTKTTVLNSTTPKRCIRDISAPRRKKKEKERKPPSKKKVEVKRQRKEADIAVMDEVKEKRPLLEAITLLRAAEASHPWATFELFIKAKMGSGIAVPKGRFNLPRFVKAKSEDRILVFADGRQAEEAKRAGAHIVGGMELIEPLINNRLRATTILSTTAMIKPISPRLGRVLGPLGLMPSTRRGTVTDDIPGYIRRMSETSEWKADKSGNIRMPIAKMSFPVEDVVQNIRYFVDAVKVATGNKRGFSREDRNKRVTKLEKVMLSSTQGPGIRLADAL